MNFHKILITIFSLFLSSQTFSAACFMVDQKDITVGWTAFKTPAKVGVNASLPGITLTSKNKGKSVKEIIKKAAITIDATAVSSGNKSRDKKIAKHFFGNMKNGPTIKASVVSMNKKAIKIKLMLNNKSIVVPMSYTLNDSMLSAKGHLDVLDVALGKSLGAINKACKALHEGKTWSDVNLNFNVKFTKC